ncbi:hypothetical protein [Glycomyces sp. MUSA5-2]|uniref:hypothetical protein n=1 Tax=Glycomyces sp. MUSA5-2 TaxID=2053002 RepID=UPI00300B1197
MSAATGGNGRSEPPVLREFVLSGGRHFVIRESAPGVFRVDQTLPEADRAEGVATASGLGTKAPSFRFPEGWSVKEAAYARQVIGAAAGAAS